MGETASKDLQMRVLVVEDDPALQRMILAYFEENNIRTLVASGRQEEYPVMPPSHRAASPWCSSSHLALLSLSSRMIASDEPH